MQYTVELSQAAFLSMANAALESYIIDNKGKKKLECYGHLWGSEQEIEGKRTYIRVEHATLDSKARSTTKSVTPKINNLYMQKEFMKAFSPHTRFLGDYHTHPYEDFQEAERNRGWEFSEGDRKDIENKTFWAEQGLKISLVVAIGGMQRHGSKEHDYLKDRFNTFFFTLGRYRLWYTAYVTKEMEGKLSLFPREQDWPASVSYDPLDSVFLLCPTVFGVWPHGPFKA